MFSKVWFFLLLIALVGCTETGKLTGDPVKPAVASTPVSSTKAKQTKTLKLKLTLDSPSDLLVQEGDQVSKGQILVDRKSVRAELEAQRQLLQLKLATLEAPTTQVIQPEPSYAVELANVEVAKLEIQGLEVQIRGFQQGSGYTPVAWSELPMEDQQRELLGLKQKLGKAKGDLKLAIAHLNQAKSDYQRQVQADQAKVAMNRKELAAERLQLTQQLQNIESQIATTGKVKAPQSGEVKKLKWLGMQDQNMQVEVSLAVQGRDHETSASR